MIAVPLSRKETEATGQLGLFLSSRKICCIIMFLSDVNSAKILLYIMLQYEDEKPDKLRLKDYTTFVFRNL